MNDRSDNELQKKGPTLNVAVWMPPDYHRTPPEVRVAGPFVNGMVLADKAKM